MDLLTWLRNQWDRATAWVLVGIGGLAVVLGWVGVTGTPYTFEQIPYVISGGLGGLFLLGVGAMLWISADLRDEWRTLNRLLELHEERTARDGGEERDGVDVHGSAPSSSAGANGQGAAPDEPPRRPRRRTPLSGKAG